MPLSAPPSKILFRCAETLAFAALGALVFASAGFPAGLISGSMLAVAVAAVLGRPVVIPLALAPPAGGPQGGLAALFDNPSYGTFFTTFSPLRLFTSVDSNVTEGVFFVPGTNGGRAATVNAFGAVFTDVDR